MTASLLIPVLLLTAAAPPQDTTTPLATIGPWTVHAEENICALSHRFGVGDAGIVVAFQPIFTAESMEVLVMSRSKSGQQHIGKAKLRFAPGGQELEARYFSIATKTKGQRYTRITVSREAFDLMQSSTEMSISALPVSTTIRIPQSTKAVATFRNCENSLLQSWGVDPTTVTPERAAKPLNPARAFGPDSFPAEALSQGFIGRVVALVQVDTTGHATACRIVAGVAETLNDATCKGALRVRYQPGTDAAGRPAPSITILPVNWQR